MREAIMIGAMPHRSTRPILALCACVLIVAAVAKPAAAKSYSAERFDSVVRVLPDGGLDVTETVVFRFIDGTFKEVFREVPVRYTDAVTVVSAGMEGQTLPFGSELGTVSVRQTNGRVRVVWRFRPVEEVTRTFVLNYRVSGVVRQEAGEDVLVWRTTPNEHAYTIDSSTTRFELPVQPRTEPGITARKTGSFEVTSGDKVVEITTRQIAANGWIDARFEFPARSVASVAPRWQQRASHIEAGVPAWIGAAALVLAAGVILLSAWRLSYQAPPPTTSAGFGYQQPPDDLRPAMSGVLAASGRPALEHVMASLFSLADRGVLQIEEERRLLGIRNFIVTRRAGAGPLLPHEERMLDLMFRDRSGESQAVSLTRARGRLTRRWRQLAKALEGELVSAGFLDDARRRLRRRYNLTALAFVALALGAAVPAIISIPGFGPWPLLIAAALAALALTSLIFGASVTVLSDEGVRRARLWRDYRKHLRLVAAGKEPATGISLQSALPYAIALGLASPWAKFVKTQPHLAPPWFRALPTSSADSAAFVAFISHGGAGASSGGHGAAGAGAGAAGGGASGAG
jgi:hypothetical protein